MLERGSVEDVRSASRALLLSLAAGDGVTCCPSLAEQSGLSRATVNAIADELQRAGVLVSHGIGHSSGGRQPALLRLGDGALLRRLAHPDPSRLRTIDLADAARQG